MELVASDPRGCYCWRSGKEGRRRRTWEDKRVDKRGKREAVVAAPCSSSVASAHRCCLEPLESRIAEEEEEEQQRRRKMRERESDRGRCSSKGGRRGGREGKGKSKEER